MIHVYNAAPGSVTADAAIQVTVVRDCQPVFTKPLIKVVTAEIPDAARSSQAMIRKLGDAFRNSETCSSAS